MAEQDQNQAQSAASMPRQSAIGDLFTSLLSHIASNPDVRQRLAAAIANWVVAAIEGLVATQTQQLAARRAASPARMAGDASIRGEQAQPGASQVIVDGKPVG